MPRFNLCVLLALTLGAAGCAAEVGLQGDPGFNDDKPYDDEPTYAEDMSEEVALATAAIRNGIDVVGKRGVVRISRDGSYCTGALINSRYMITAAHCVVQDLGGYKQGTIKRTVVYFKPDGSTPRLTAVDEVMNAYVVESYGGSGDQGDDLALVERVWGDWLGTSSADYLRISQGTCDQIDLSTLYGSGSNSFGGTGSGVLRTMPSNLKGCQRHFFYDLAGTRQVCHGDSGGPYIIDLSTGIEVITGLIVEMDDGNDRNCTVDGGEQKSVRLNSKLTWMEGKMGQACTRFTHSNGHPYARCF